MGLYKSPGKLVIHCCHSSHDKVAKTFAAIRTTCPAMKSTGFRCIQARSPQIAASQNKQPAMAAMLCQTSNAGERISHIGANASKFQPT